MADSAATTSLLDPMKTKKCREDLRKQYYKEVEQLWKFNILEGVLKGAASLIKLRSLSGSEGLNPEFDFLLKESEVILCSLKDASKSDRSESLSKEVVCRIRCLIVLVKLQKQQLARRCGTVEHVKLCKSLIESDRQTGTSGDRGLESTICKMAKEFCNSDAARNHERFLKSTDEQHGRSDWNGITPWMEKFEVLHEYYIQIAPLSKLPGFKRAYDMLKSIYQTASLKDLPTQEGVDVWAYLKEFSLEATKNLVSFLKHTENLHGNKGKKVRSKLQRLMPDLPTETDKGAIQEFRRKCCEDLIGSTTFEMLTKCHEIVQNLTTCKDEPTASSKTVKAEQTKDKSALENLKKFMDNVKWEEIKNCYQCKDVDMKSRIREALTFKEDLKQFKKNILSDLGASVSSPEWEAVRLHKEAFDTLERAGGIKISVRKHLLRELDRRHGECKGKGSFSHLLGQADSLEVHHVGTCEDYKNNAHAKRSLERILDEQKLPAIDQQYLLSIIDDPSSCENCNEILSLQEAYQNILEDKPLSDDQTNLLLNIYTNDVSCGRCSVIGSNKTQAEQDDTHNDLKDIWRIHRDCKQCQDTLLCVKAYEATSQEAPLDEDTRNFVSEILRNVENAWKCEGQSTNCMETFLELCKNDLSPNSRFDIIEKLNREHSSICPHCQDELWKQTMKSVRDKAALQEEQVEFLKDIILSHACEGCSMLMEQIKVRKTLKEDKVLSSNLRALLSETILPRTSQCKSYRQLKRCMAMLKKVKAGDTLTQEDESCIKHISDATENCQTDGCNVSRERELSSLDQDNYRCAIVRIWNAGLKCKNCHVKLLHISETAHSQVDKKYSQALDKIRDHLSDEQRLECNICEGFYVPQDPINVNHLQLEKKLTQSQMQDALGSTFRYPAVISKNRERRRRSQRGSGKRKGSFGSVEVGEKGGKENTAGTKEKDAQQRGLHSLMSANSASDGGCQGEDEDKDTMEGAWANNRRSEEGKINEEKNVSGECTADGKGEKPASSSKPAVKDTFVKHKDRRKKSNKAVARSRGVAKAASRTRGKGIKGKGSHSGSPSSVQERSKKRLANEQSNSQVQDRDRKEDFPKKRDSIDNSVGQFEEMAAIDDVVNVLLKWRKKLGIPLCLLTNYDYTGIRNSKDESVSNSKGEIDIIGFSRHLGVILVELKAVNPDGSNIKKSVRVAQEQLQRDERFFYEVTRDWPSGRNIPVIQLIALPYVPCSILAKMGLCNLHKSRVVTKCDMDKFILEPGNLDKFTGTPSQKFLVSDNDYCKLLERFYGLENLLDSPYSLAKGIKTVGRDMSHIFLTEDQTELIMADNRQYQFIAGGYGTGKSLMLVSKAKEIARGKLDASANSPVKSIFIVSCPDITVSGEKINLEQPDGSLNHLKRLMGKENHPGPNFFDHVKFLMVKDFIEGTPNTKAGNDLAETLANAIEVRASSLSEVHFCFDEIPFKFLKQFKWHIEKLIQAKPSIKTFWFSVATHSFRVDASDSQNADWVKCECPKNFKFKYLGQNLRVPGNTLRLHKEFEKSMNDGHIGTERGYVPPGPKPLLYRVPLCDCQELKDCSIHLNRDCTHRRMTATLKAIFIKLGILVVTGQKVATTSHQWPSNSITMLLPSVTNESFENALSHLLKDSCARLGIEVEDRRYKTPPSDNAANQVVGGENVDHGEVTCQDQAQTESTKTERYADYLQMPTSDSAANPPQVIVGKNVIGHGEGTCQEQAQSDSSQIQPHVGHLQVRAGIRRSVSSDSDYNLDILEEPRKPHKEQEEPDTSCQEQPKRPKIMLTTETGFVNCESYVVICVDLNAMLYCFRGSKGAYTTCGISRCLSQYIHMTWHFKEAEKFFKAQTDLVNLSSEEIQYALDTKPSLEKFLEEGHILEETVENLP